MNNSIKLVLALCIMFTACSPKMQPGTSSDVSSTTENTKTDAKETNLPKSQTLLKADDKVIEGTMQR